MGDTISLCECILFVGVSMSGYDNDDGIQGNFLCGGVFSSSVLFLSN